MTNPFYNPSGNPGQGSEGLSSLMRSEFAAIGTAFNLMPRITTTGLFDTVFTQSGSYTFTLPSAPGALAMLSDVAVETTRAKAAEVLLAPLLSPLLTGTPTAPTATPGTSTTQLATTAFSAAAVQVENTRAVAAEALLAPLSSPALSGNPTVPTAAPGTNTTQAASTAFSTAAVAVETARAQSAESTLTTAISNETARAGAAEAIALGGIGRNRLHNGGFGINQRSYASGASLAAGVYGHDRWKAGAGGCTYTFTQTQPTTVITITAGTLQQVVEALTVEGGSYTLSWIGTATARINSGSYLASPIAVSGLAANTAITVEFSTGTVDRAQLEIGSTASTFARRSYRYELAECQRFYQTGYFLVACYQVSGQVASVVQSLLVSMRAAFTITPYYIINSNTSSISFGALGNQYLLAQFNATSTGAVELYGSFTASADL